MTFDKSNTESVGERVSAMVNGDPVALPAGGMTGSEIKQEAIAQGAELQVGFQLSLVTHRDRCRVVDDEQVVTVSYGLEFVAVTQDDHS